MKTVLIAFLALFPSTASAWGPVGHRVVGKIAENHLSEKAKTGLRALMGTESLARSSTWADEMRSHPNRAHYGKFDPWHYATVPQGEKYGPQHAPAAGDVVKALSDMEAVLSDSKARREAKIEALRLFVHFAGDVHQPLHVGMPGDFGGNTCWVKWFGKPEKLHGVWDENLIDHLKLSYTEYAEFLDHAEEAVIKEWQGAPYSEWADESSALLPGVYPDKERAYCGKSWNEKIDEKLMPELSWKYAFDHRANLDRRLLQAGLRLAGALNRIFQ